MASGGGLHIYWLLQNPRVRTNPTGRADFAWPGPWRGLAAAETARVLRLPGSLNYKYSPSRKVELWASPAEWDRRYFLEDFLPFAHSRPTHAASAPTSAAGKIPEGQRNVHLASLAGSMRRRGMSPSAIEAALIEENRRCDPPLAESEVRVIAKSIRTEGTFCELAGRNADTCGATAVFGHQPGALALALAGANSARKTHGNCG